MYRKTYIEINLDNISNNVKNIIKKYSDYKYYIGMVKGNCYGHGMYTVNTLIESGINYLAVSSLDEALEIRNYNKNIPILCTEIIDEDEVSVAIKNNVTLTVDNVDYLKKINESCKIHIKINTGMNRLGVNTKSEFNELYKYIKSNSNIYLEGIYTHFATPGIKDIYFDKQLKTFKDTVSDIDLKEIPIIHLSSSFIVLSHPKIEFATGIRIGTIMYGYDISLSKYGTNIRGLLTKTRDNYLIKKNNISPVIRDVSIDLKPAFSLKTNVMEIREVKKGELLGYGTHIVDNDYKIAVLPIGYEDGIGINNDNRYVLINGTKYKCIGPISMCMMFVIVDDKVSVQDEVIVLGDKLTLGYMSRLNNMGIQETLVTLGQRLKRKYIKNNKLDKII